MIYVFQTNSTEKTPYNDALLGMPIIDGMSLSNALGSITIRDTLRGTTSNLAGGTYTYIDL